MHGNGRHTLGYKICSVDATIGPCISPQRFRQCVFAPMVEDLAQTVSGALLTLEMASRTDAGNSFEECASFAL